MKKIIVPILACMLTSGIYAQKAVEKESNLLITGLLGSMRV